MQLLLDYISGRPELTLDNIRPAPQPAGAPGPSSPGDDIIDRISRMRFPPEGTVASQADDARFLLHARDRLNNLAWPARGKSIAFTSLVTAADQRGSRASLAALAYPELTQRARRLRGWMWVLIVAMIAIGLITVWLSCELAAGKLLLGRIDAIKGQADALAAQIEKAEPPAAADAHVVRYCDRPSVLGPASVAVPTGMMTGVQQFDTATQYHLCDQQLALVNLRKGAYEHLQQWLRRMLPVGSILAVPLGGTGEHADDMRWTLESGAAVLVGTLGGYVLPVFYAFLGAGVSAVRTYYARIAASVLMPRDLVLSWVRISLGMVIGSLIGLIASPVASAGSGTGVATGITLSGAALAFLAGYGVEQVFGFFDDLLLRVFRPSSQPARPTGTTPGSTAA